MLGITKCFKTASAAAKVLDGTIALDLQVEMESKFQNTVRSGKDIFFYGLSVKATDIAPPRPPYAEPDLRWTTLEPLDLGVKYFTDGSKLHGKVGAAFVHWEDGVERYRASYRLEIFIAIEKATEYHSERMRKSGTLYSDSQSALAALCTSKTQLLQVNRARGCAAKAGLTLCFVKALVGYPGNERANDLAKEATRRVQVDCNAGIPKVIIKLWLKEEAVKEWQRRWDCNTVERKTFRLFP